MDFRMSHTFHANIDRVWAMFTTPDFHVAKAVSGGHRDIEVTECEQDPDNFVIKISRVVDAELPGFAKKVLKPTNTVLSVDEWRDNGDGTFGGEWHMDTVGAPVKVTGTTKISEIDDQTTRYDLAFTLEVNIPIIGGKIADWGKGDAIKQVERDFAAGDDWLAEHA